jgi:predicted tellurium resistance membrane protein TerC
MFEVLTTSQGMIALLMLTLMEVVLGIDNIIFISIVANKLPEKDQPRARNLGLLLALGLRVVLLFGLTLIMAMQEPWFGFAIGETIHEGTADMAHGDQRLGHHGDGITYLLHGQFTGQSIILFVGGLFLLWKSVSEIHHKLEGEEEHAGGDGGASKPKVTVKQAVIQIALLNIVFSFDSILTAVGLTQDLSKQGFDPILIMILGVMLSMLIMLSFAAPLGRFVNKHPSIQMLALSFLILIGFMLITEGAHLAHVQVLHTHVDTIPKGYLYFAMMFALLVEFLNIRTRSKSKPVQMRGVFSEAKDRHLYDLDK